MQEAVKQAIARCRELGLRRTRALEELLATLVERSRPMTLAELAASARLADLCDKATVYRLLQRLTEKGIIRRLGLHERAAYFTLLQPGKHSDYLICTGCGKIEAVKAPAPSMTSKTKSVKKPDTRDCITNSSFSGLAPTAFNLPSSPQQANL